MTKELNKEWLLTEGRVAFVGGKFSRPENRGQGLHLLVEMSAKAELEFAEPLIRASVYKEIGEWLKKNGKLPPVNTKGQRVFLFECETSQIERLLAGKSPTKEKK